VARQTLRRDHARKKQAILAAAAAQSAEFERFRRPTRRDVFLQTMDAIVPWAELRALIEPYYPKAGNFASYARTVDSRRESNGKKKGDGNAKCGNKHLAWAFIEAAHFAVRYDETIRRWFQKKCVKTLQVVAIKAVAHKLARACLHVMKTGSPPPEATAR
jgi:transposase